MTAGRQRFVKNESLLRRILWADAALGGSTAVTGLRFPSFVAALFGLRKNLLLTIAVVTLAYAVLAFYLVLQKPVPPSLALALVCANWVWTGISVVLLLFRHREATTLGDAFLILQVLVVGGLAYREGARIGRRS